MSGPAEQIMRCEDCGIVDHHCIGALCPRCREREAMFERSRVAHELAARRTREKAERLNREAARGGGVCASAESALRELHPGAF